MRILMSRPFPLLILSLLCFGSEGAVRVPLAAAEDDPAPLVRLAPLWSRGELQHESVALGLFARDGWVYVAGGHDESGRGRASKVRIEDGTVAWSVKVETYQPSFPVSNGHVVVFGEFYSGNTVALDDASGAPLWKVPTRQMMSAACFAGDLVLCGSYHPRFYGLYAIDWRTGEVRWKTPLGEKIRATPALHGDRVLVGCHDGSLSAIEVATGKVAWSLDCGGRIASSLAVVGDFAFLAVDGQRSTDAYDGTKDRKELVVIELKEPKVIARYPTPYSWNPRIVANGDLALFSDTTKVHTFDVARATHAYQMEPPTGLLPWPLVLGDRLILAMRPLPRDCFAGAGARPPDPVPLAVYDRKTGARLSVRPEGGFVATGAACVQVEDVVVVAGGPTAAYRILPTESAK